MFEGRRFTLTEMLVSPSEHHQRRPGTRCGRSVIETAEDAATLVASGADFVDGWRFGVLQTLDIYESALRNYGPQAASAVFDEIPPMTGSVDLDAAFAALADYLADRDGWPTPEWAVDPSRRTSDCFAAVLSFDRAEALVESPQAFRNRGIFITARSLARA